MKSDPYNKYDSVDLRLLNNPSLRTGYSRLEMIFSY